MERIDKETLRGWLGDANVYILDLRVPRDWEASQAKIEHAHHFDPLQPVETWAQKLPKDKKIVAYCA